MKNLYDAWLIQIEVTRRCISSCAHCTRAIGHWESPHDASLEFIETALKTLKGWPKGVGCVGGEPTLHQNFEEICLLYQKFFPRRQCAIFTSGGESYISNKDLINKTFGIIHYNDHSNIGFHQPMMIASEEIIKDDDLREKMINSCWVQEHWSPTMTEKGAFFCEVAGTFDSLFNGAGGYALEEGWWKKTPLEFENQKKQYCRFCSLPIPMNKIPSNSPVEFVSQNNYQRLVKVKSPLALKKRLHIVKDLDEIYSDKQINRNPVNYFADEQKMPFWFFKRFYKFSFASKIIFIKAGLKRYMVALSKKLFNSL